MRSTWLDDVYRDLHAHPELSFQEARTSGIVERQLDGLGYQVATGVGGTGVVGLLRRGDGPTALLRADMDGLPVREETGLAYASTVTTTSGDGRLLPVMHACGHDVHVTCLLGAAAELARDTSSWQGTLMLVFQPAEEVGKGALAMIEDGLFTRFGRPDVVLGQHVAPIPAGMLALRPGVAFAGADGLRVLLRGRGAHGSRPEASVDPVVAAASTVMRLQGIVSREVAATDAAVVTVGAVAAGTRGNIIPEEAELLLSARTFSQALRLRVLDAIERIVHAEAAASGPGMRATIEMLESFPAVENDAAACARTQGCWRRDLAEVEVLDPGVVTGSEDVGLLATGADAPCVYWLLGGADPQSFAGASTFSEINDRMRDLPSNHSPHFAPVIQPTLDIGVRALVSAARCWLPAGRRRSR